MILSFLWFQNLLAERFTVFEGFTEYFEKPEILLFRQKFVTA